MGCCQSWILGAIDRGVTCGRSNGLRLEGCGAEKPGGEEEEEEEERGGDGEGEDQELDGLDGEAPLPLHEQWLFVERKGKERRVKLGFEGGMASGGDE